MENRRLRLRKGRVLILIAIILLMGIGFFYFIYSDSTLFRKIIKDETMYLASATPKVELYNDTFVKQKEVIRGTKVKSTKKELNNEEKTYIKIKLNKEELYVLKENLTNNKNDVVKEEKVFVRTPTSLYDDIDLGSINMLLTKGQELSVIGYDKLLDDGTVNAYKIKLNDNRVGYVYNKYLVSSVDVAVANYEPVKYYDVHNKRKDVYSNVGGTGGGLDYYPVDKPTFENNKMPEKVYALYLNSGRNVIGNVDAYIDYAKTTKINAFVVDIKDNESPGYKSKVFEKYSPTNYKYANNTYENYKTAIEKIKDAGFYVIGRITTFKDKYFVLDNTDIAIIDKRTNAPLDTGTYWPSPYQRKVWEFNVNLAKEAVKEMGFNEIQFDYVRFPDLIVSQERAGYLDFRNTYNEEKVQAIQRFVMYACDELHKLNAYVSVDVFGESVNTYITAYGQYWPAISNVVDVISGMPYPDHFSTYSYGIPEPWTEPYKLMNSWGLVAASRQKEIPTPAIVRTWILAQNTMKGFAYNAEHIEAQIKGLVDSGLTGGYMTWASASSIIGYKNRNAAYIKEY